MLVIRDRDDHGVDIFPIEDLSVVTGRRNLLLHRFARRLMPAVVKIADGHALNAGDKERRLQQFATAHASANRGEPHQVARGHGTRGSREQVWLKERNLRSGHRSAADLDELTTRQ